MSLFTESPLAIVVGGGVAATFALIVFLARRTPGALAGLGGVIALTLALLAVERWTVTDRELIDGALHATLAAVEANDPPGVMSRIDPAAVTVRSDAQSLMPMLKVIKARALGEVEIEINAAASPPTARSRFHAFLEGVHSSSGMPIGYINQRVDIDWIKRGDQWLVQGYTAYFDDQPIDAVGSARSKRPVSER